ncbi:AraC family transcriptional regulator [Sutcliffiella horikoshii]|uniref:AraC family transcriptional regulator n=1 Tax=Sutcliffiella horikoshii TaxID=79883 RepID=A0A5D4T575_9BACI|nr:effector binding domain-containing protein [Sutcliffiella horikoshii]TYS70449.1 AraC family transcriptional regulator [Sutcliffiella horikoshii]
MIQNSIATFKCEVVQKKLQLVGQCATGNFPQSFPEVAMNVQQDFENRRDEVSHVVDRNVIYCPYLANSLVATYFACVEVNEFATIPSGMMAINIPITTYAKITCSNKTVDKSYERVFSWMKDNGYRQESLEKALPIEVFYFEDDAEEEMVELYIPVIH